MGNLGQLAPARSSPSLKTNSPDARTYTAGLCHPGFGSGPAARWVPVPRRTALSRGHPRDRVRSAGHGLSVSRARRPARHPRRSRQTRACEVPAKFVPAAAVTRRGRALLARTGRKAFVGGRPRRATRCFEPPRRVNHFELETDAIGRRAVNVTDPFGSVRGCSVTG